MEGLTRRDETCARQTHISKGSAAGSCLPWRLRSLRNGLSYAQRARVRTSLQRGQSDNGPSPTARLSGPHPPVRDRAPPAPYAGQEAPGAAAPEPTGRPTSAGTAPEGQTPITELSTADSRSGGSVTDQKNPASLSKLLSQRG